LKTHLLLASIFVIAIVLLGIYVGLRIIPTETSTSSTIVTTLSNAEVIQNVTYCIINDHPQQMDIYIPLKLLENSSAKEPVVVFIHGGGWISGSMVYDWHGLYPVLEQNDFVVASINYFLAPPTTPPYGFPENIEDVECAVRYLRFNSGAYRIDPDHIGVVGDSAGGNLASLLGLASINGTFDDAGQYSNFSSRVQAVVDAFGPANLTDPALHNPNTIEDLARAFGNSVSNLLAGSPVNYVSLSAPPFLIIQGKNDTTVPPEQSIEFYNALRSKGNDANLILVSNAGHEFVQVGSQPISPSLGTLLSYIVDFLNSALRG
jgi:acetyl esterase/lipase